MREIKFRAKISPTHEGFEYGLIVRDYEGNMFLTTLDGTSTCAVDENTIGQFTGLKDKNGKEIYEGDVIKEYDEVLKVFYNSCTASFDIEYSGGDCDRLVYKDGHSEHTFEIIGNVHENPELS